MGSPALIKTAARLSLDPDRFFASDPTERRIARTLYEAVADYPILSPHGHTDPAWFAHNAAFENPTALFLSPDHYLYRMLYSQGVSLDSLGVRPNWSDPRPLDDPRAAWSEFARHYYLFAGTPSRQWMDHVFSTVFGLNERFDQNTADAFYDAIDAALKTDAFRPRALFERFRIGFLATTEGATDTLAEHQAIRSSGWSGRVVTTYRPDSVVDPEHEQFDQDLARFAALTGESLDTFASYLRAHQTRRAYFRSFGATATDHGHPTARTANLSPTEAEKLYAQIRQKDRTPEACELFRAQMLTEMARMSLDDGMTLQIHAGARRNHNRGLFKAYGRDKGADIPGPTEYVEALRPMLDVFGNEPDLSIIVFTLDEAAYSRELAPLAGHYPCLRLGPAWWFHDSPEGMLRFREQVTPIAGFYNTVGFNDDTRAFLSIPARHDMARRLDARYLARLVSEHRLDMTEAHTLIHDLTDTLPRSAYKI